MKLPKWLFFLVFLLTFLIVGICQFLEYHTGFQQISGSKVVYTLDESIASFDLNLISYTDLQRISGMNSLTAGQIVSYRKEHGGFSDTSELLEVPRIPEQLEAFLIRHCYVSQPATKAEEPETVPDTTDSTEVPETVEMTEAVLFPLNLNTADAASLQALPGIGEVLAGAIVAYRTQIGGYSYREQLLEISGIGEGTFSAIRDLVMIPNETPPPPPESPAPPQEVSTTEALPVETEPVCIDLNTAGYDELMQLPGCTPELAEGILSLRNMIGEFQNTLEILYVEGIGNALYESWKPYLKPLP